MPPLRAIAAESGPALPRLRRLLEAVRDGKRRWAASDPELFSAYRALVPEAQSAVAAHVEDLTGIVAAVVAAGIAQGTFRALEPRSAARAILIATSRFHHPLHYREWAGDELGPAFDDVWELLASGLCVPAAR